MRLDKLLEAAEVGSRKQVKRLLISRQVKVDGQVIQTGSFNVDPALQHVTLRDEILEGPAHVYYMLNKPKGAVSAVRDQRHQTVVALINQSDRRPGLFPVGRLDRDTEGLLLLTDNGKLAHQLLGPLKGVIKQYEAVVNERVTEADVQAFQRGITFHGGVTCQPARLEILSASQAESRVLLSITEGKFHQVKKMFLAVGKKVTYLKRLTMGSLVLDKTLSPGDYRSLTSEELTLLQAYFNERSDIND